MTGGQEKTDFGICFSLRIWAFHVKAVRATYKSPMCTCFSDDPFGPFLAVADIPGTPTPTRAEEHIATTPGCGPAGHRAFAHTDTRRGTYHFDAGL